MFRRELSRSSRSLRRASISVAILVGLSCTPQKEIEPAQTEIAGPIMGTFFSVKIPGEHGVEDQRRFERLIQAQLAEVDGKMSTYREESELSVLNATATTEPVEVSEALFEVMAAALEISRQTRGAYDITIGPVVNAWGFGPRGLETGSVSPEEIAKLLDRVGYEHLHLDPELRTVQRALPDLYLDLSSIAKGYAVDRVASALEHDGLSSFWIEVGGEVRVLGHNAHGNRWRLGIERPQLAPGAVQKILHLDGHAVATSGDYRNYREVDGERFSHILDPRNGWPIKHRLASVSVVQPSCMMADGLATALLVMGLEEGYALAEKKDLAAYFLVRDGHAFEERATPAFDRLSRLR